MPNILQSIPVSKSKVSEMITVAGPTIVNAAYPLDFVYLNETLENITCFYSNLGPSGTLVENIGGVVLACGTTLDSWVEIYKQIRNGYPVLTWPKKRSLMLSMTFAGAVGADIDYWLVSGKYGNNRHIGFKIINGVLYGTCYNTAESTVQLTGGAYAAFTFATHTLRFDYDGAANVKFYYDGEYRGEITTNIPTLSTDADKIFDMNILCLNAGSDGRITFNNFVFYQEE